MENKTEKLLQTEYRPLDGHVCRALIAWYRENGRDLPWRKDPQAYHVWVSEIMLQQTRVEAVKPYYARFLEALPTIEDLARADEDTLMKLWEGLGYYNRVRNMQKAARIIVERYGGVMPSDHQEILALPGIGPYTAGAIGSIACGLLTAAVDGNVLRVLSRFQNCGACIDKAGTKKQAEAVLCQTLLQTGVSPGEFNQALMDLGAMVCVPNGPARCARCPIRQWCRGFSEKTVESLPVRGEKHPRSVEKLTVLVVANGQRTAIRKRPADGLLPGLYEFPVLRGWKTQEEVLDFLDSMGTGPLHIEPLPDARHIFTHITWRMKGYFVRLSETEEQGIKDWLFVGKEDIDRQYAIPSAFSRYKEFLDRL